MPLIVRGLAHSDYMVGAFQGEDNLRTSLTKMVVVMVEVTSDLDCLCLGCLDHWQIGISTDRLLDSLPGHIRWICCRWWWYVVEVIYVVQVIYVVDSFFSILIIPGDCAHRAGQRKTLFNSYHLITFRRSLITKLWLFGGNALTLPVPQKWSKPQGSGGQNKGDTFESFRFKKAIMTTQNNDLDL